MAQQIKVNSATGNIQIQISRGAIGPSTTANIANTALNLNAASTANVIIGGGVANYVLQTDGAGNTSWVAQTGGGATNPAGANTQVQFNDQGSFGAESNFTYDKATDVLTVDHFSGEAGNLSNIQGANVSGEVSFAATANAVALANVTGAGNIASINLDGNVSNVLAGDGTFIAAGGGATAPGGSNTQVQYNDNGSFAGEAGFEYNDVTNTLTVDNISANISGTVTGDVDGALLVDVYNNTGVTLNKGDAVYLTGGNNGDNPHVALADADDPTKMPALGVVKENIATASVGQVTTSGVMNDSSHGYTLGADLYVSTTPGQLTTTIPTGEANLIQKIGKVVNANQIIVQGAFRTNATPNLDEGNIFIGNASNQATSAVLNDEINTHLAAFGSNTITTTGNVDTGNLTATTSLFVDGVSGNVLIQPNVQFDGDTFGIINRGEWDSGVNKSTLNQAYITDNYVSEGLIKFDTYANTAAGQLAKGAGFSIQGYSAIGNANTDPLVSSQVGFTSYPGSANLAKADTGTTTSMTMGGGTSTGFLTVIGSEADDAIGNGAWRQFQYRPKAMEFIRRAGNADSRQSPVANDETSLNFYSTQTNSGNPGVLYNYPAKIGSKIDPGWTDPNDPFKATPSGVFFTVVSEDSANLEHRMYANGTTTFNAFSQNFSGTPIATNPVSIGLNGTVTANAFTATTGVFTGDGGGLSNVASANVTGLGNIATINIDGSATNVLYGNGVFAPAGGGGGVQAQIANGTSNVNIATVDGNVDITVSGNTSVIATDIGAIVQNEPQGNITISPGGAFGAGYVSNQYEPVSLKFFRRDGNSTNKVSPSANTETSFDFYTTQTNGGVAGEVYNYAAKIGSKVDPGWTDPNDPFKATPSGLFYKVVSEDSSNLEHRMYANGTTTFNAFSQDFTGTPISTNPVSIGLNGTVTANAFTATTGVFTGDGGGLSNVVAAPGGFFDSVQFNDNGVLGGDATLTYQKTVGANGGQLNLNGTAGTTSGMPTFNVKNGGFTIVQEEIGGGQESFSFKNFYAGTQIAPSSYFRARGTFAAQTGVAVNDQVLNEGYNVNAGGTGPAFKNVGSVTGTIISNDGAGNVGLNYSINTSGADVFENDKIQLNTSLTDVSGNLRMTGNNQTILTATRFRGQTDIFANLPTVGVSTGERAMITDLNTAFSFGSIVTTGGGSTTCPVYYDGSNWRQG